MKAVGIKVLKNNLSRYLREVRAGELIWVTDRDEVIAEIHKPTTPQPGQLSRWEAWLNEQERLGKIRRAKGTGPSLRELLKLPRLNVKVNLQALLDETRADPLFGVHHVARGRSLCS
ncbi:MAG: toxin-antitoxin system, antitoxin component [Verrucomicrobia bacterium]|nr:toxin-antitoxin system, antitoxin component [Verrucomicrobiota bacterium]